MARLAVELSYTSDQAGTEALSQAAVETAERVGDARILLLAMYSRQWSTMGPDGLEANLAAGDEIIRLARVVGDREMEFNGHHLLLNIQLQLGDMRAVDREIRSCEKLAAELRQPGFEWQTAAFRGMRALLQGRIKEGERLAQAALTLGQRVQPEMALVVLGAQTFMVSWATGKLADIEAGGAAFAEQYPKSAWPAAYAFLLSELGERDKARERLDAIARGGFDAIRRDGNWLTAMATLSMVCNFLEDRGAAAALYEMYRPYADHLTPVLTGYVCFGSNHTFAGCFAQAAGQLDAAVEHYERALEVNEAIGAAFILARVCTYNARARLARAAPGDRERATELVEMGLEGARAIGLPKEVERLLAIRLDRAGLADMDVQTSIEAVATSVEQDRPDITPAAAPDGTVTIMFSDIEDSTVLTERLGDRRWLELLTRHNEIVRRYVAAHAGYEVKSQGDGFMLAFSSAGEGIQCAIDVQRDLAEHGERNPEEQLRIRIGLHTGETLRAEEDFFGKNVILAARIAARASGGEILVSSLLREIIGTTRDFEFASEQELELKGLTGRYRVFAVRWSDAPLEPSLEPAPSH
jgi:eukaryotic-like serine/threonine-protein kinase